MRSKSPTTRRMIASAITSRKRVTRPCTMTSPQAPAIRPKEGVDLVPDHLRALVLVLVLGLAQAAGATATSNHHDDQDDRKPSAAPKQGYSSKHGYSYSSESDDGGRIHCPDKSNTVFATFSAPKTKKKHTQK
jgi:hypothetical protein